MPTNLRESGFEEHIEKYLIDEKKNAYSKRSPKDYDKEHGMDIELLMNFLQSTQAKEWQKLTEHHGEDFVQDKFLKRLDEEIAARGVLDVLRKGLKDNGCSFTLAYFQPATGINEETKRLFSSNIFSAVRQLKYSAQNENSIDMVLFLNGLPIFTIELKNQLTGQSIAHGKKQYRCDRDPREMLLSFKRCLAHFAIDTEEVAMTTKLEGLRTHFLPFNKGDGLAAGNPVNPKGYKTAYMWEEILRKEMVLEIISRFMHIKREEKVDNKGKKVKKEVQIFPRYHQLQTVRKLIANTRENGAGRNYLIQHSAGSGKSNTIAWTAHRLAELHDEKDQKVFDSVIIVTDRRVLDHQLQETVAEFEQVRGVVKKIDEHSSQLKEALEHGEKIIITTLQKFPVISNSVGELPGKRFAVLIDEAHSSQSGEQSKALKKALTTTLEDAEKEDAVLTEPDTEDKIVEEMRARGRQKNVSFLAFTATPKQKTLELFGEKLDDGSFAPYSIYSMKQAIEEGFILDVLKNYTTYKTYFHLMKKVQEDPEYQKNTVQRLLINYVDIHPHTIGMKVQIIMDHFSLQIAHQIRKKAKAMIVTRSRLHAVRYKIAMDTYLKEKHLPYKALVAFSGTVKDGGMEYTEANMNGVPDTQTAEMFEQNEYKFLIVAEKFQTGFDQPLLEAMYVDKKLSDLNAVQTLSRLNRMYQDKEETFVLDFVNDTEMIKKAFQPYYETTVLSEGTDPNILHNLASDIFATKLFAEEEVERISTLYFTDADPGRINSEIDFIAKRVNELKEQDMVELQSILLEYIKKYAFISQIITYTDTSLEKLYVFLRILVKKMKIERTELPKEVLDKIDLESIKIPRTTQGSIALDESGEKLEPMGDGRGGLSDEDTDFLSLILKEVNERFGTEFTTEDRVILNDLSKRLLENKKLKGTIQNNAVDAAKIRYKKMYQDEKVKMLNSHYDLYEKLDQNKDMDEHVMERIFEFVVKKLEE
jgi:type I restriction enzyme, R subunit